MQPTRRRQPAPWERGGTDPRHPLGRPRRRFPAESGGVPFEGVPARRYRRAFDGAGDPRVERRVDNGVRLERRRRGVMERMRRTPMRDGLIGLSVVGAAAPLAMSRLGALRTDSAHEQTVFSQAEIVPINEQTVGHAWRAAENAIAGEKAKVADEATSSREAVIQDKLERYGKMGLDRKLAESIYDLALKEDLDPDVAFGMVRTESEFKNHATSHVGAVGLTQLMPKTAAWLRPGIKPADLRDAETNLSIGFRYLRELIDKYEGDQRLALLAYNRGPGTVDRVLKRGGDPDNGYAEAVISGEGVHK